MVLGFQKVVKMKEQVYIHWFKKASFYHYFEQINFSVMTIFSYQPLNC